MTAGGIDDASGLISGATRHTACGCDLALSPGLPGLASAALVGEVVEAHHHDARQDSIRGPKRNQ